MIEYKKIDGGDLGEILLHRNQRARNYSLRVDNGQVYATMPWRGSEREMLDFIRTKHDRILSMINKRPKRKILDEQTDFRTSTFSLKIVRNELSNSYFSLKDGVLLISLPNNIDLNKEYVQDGLWNIIESTLRYEAKRVIPLRLQNLAKQHGFSYAMTKINKSRTHWGSCTAQKNINISLSLMLLPEHLIDYVLLHELCHTAEMNHSARFWELMDKVTDGKAESYRKEMRGYSML